MHRYRLTCRFMIPEEATPPAGEERSAGGSSLLVTCTDAVLDDTLLRTEAVQGTRIVRSGANRIAGPGVDPALPQLIERLVADGRITDLVLCGHSGCRHFAPAPAAVADADGATRSESWYERSLRRMAESQLAVEKAKANVVDQIAVLKRLPCVQRGDLRIAGSCYLCESGTLLLYDESSHQFRAMSPALLGAAET